MYFLLSAFIQNEWIILWSILNITHTTKYSMYVQPPVNWVLKKRVSAVSAAFICINFLEKKQKEFMIPRDYYNHRNWSLEHCSASSCAELSQKVDFYVDGKSPKWSCHEYRMMISGLRRLRWEDFEFNANLNCALSSSWTP